MSNSNKATTGKEAEKKSTPTGAAGSAATPETPAANSVPSQNTGGTAEGDPNAAIAAAMQQVQAMMEEAKAAAAKIIADATAAVMPAPTPDAVVKVKPPKEDVTRMVKVKLFKDNKRYKDPLYVSVNDYHAAIPRGIVVEVPLYVALSLEESQAQDTQTAMMIGGLVAEYEANVKDRLEGKA